MSGDISGNTIFWLVIAIIAIVVLAYIFYFFFRRSTKETAFVRTGLGGQRVVINGGAFVIPLFHDVTPVYMRTHRLVVQTVRDRAVITKDRMRVDVSAEFYVRVVPTKDGVAAAAQTLGRRSMETEALRELVEGRFVDILRSVAAEMTMEELHEQRSEYARRVREAVIEPLAKSGLEAEAVSLTSLDQTNMEFFNPSNAFDAEGLTRLTEQIEQRKKRRNDIEQDTLIA
ncbi:MAG: flotillin family protein, partial [Rhodomicrobium sp.]|nr:flotillin family protein [Rhodomicrobium sp.]